MAAKVNNKGRNKYQKHIRVNSYQYKCEAFRSLSVYSRLLLLEFKWRFNGHNNGEIHMSYREGAQALGVSDKPIRNALKELEEKGFIKKTRPGGFNIKHRHATEWALTEEPLNNKPATKEFMSWKPPEDTPLQKKSRRTLGNRAAYPEPQ